VLFDFLGRESLVPTQPVLDEREFPWAAEFKARWPKLRAELDAQLRNRAEIPRFQDISPDQYKISPDDLWRTFVLYGFGHRSELACELCPETAAALALVPKLESAFFSILAPGKHVPRHRGVTRGMVRCHLGLKVPNDPDHCWMDVGGVRCTWQDGELLFFDDTYPHEVWNDTDEERVVLLFDFERPMRWPGRVVSRLMMLALRQTAYFKDAYRNHQAWEKRYREVVAARG
jgi:beta-hydroxylase